MNEIQNRHEGAEEPLLDVPVVIRTVAHERLAFGPLEAQPPTLLEPPPGRTGARASATPPPGGLPASAVRTCSARRKPRRPCRGPPQPRLPPPLTHLLAYLPRQFRDAFGVNECPRDQRTRIALRDLAGHRQQQADLILTPVRRFLRFFRLVRGGFRSWGGRLVRAGRTRRRSVDRADRVGVRGSGREAHLVASAVGHHDGHLGSGNALGHGELLGQGQLLETLNGFVPFVDAFLASIL